MLEHFDICIYKLCKIKVSCIYSLVQPKESQKPQIPKTTQRSCLMETFLSFSFLHEVRDTLVFGGPTRVTATRTPPHSSWFPLGHQVSRSSDPSSLQAFPSFRLGKDKRQTTTSQWSPFWQASEFVGNSFAPEKWHYLQQSHLVPLLKSHVDYRFKR